MLSKDFTALNQAIKKSGDILKKYFGEQLKLDHKSTSADYRTKADIETENAIIEAIEEIFPSYNIFAEERGEIQKGSPYTFIIDPLDGTNNFVIGMPAFASSIGLMKDGEIIYGAINFPVIDDFYYAQKGKGAFLNNKPISVSPETDIKNSTISYHCSYTTPKERILDFRTKLMNLKVRRCLDIWVPTFCYCGLANGRIESIITDGIELYDFAAGKLIALEAGAKITDLDGNEINNDAADTFIISNNASIHSVLVDSVLDQKV